MKSIYITSNKYRNKLNINLTVNGFRGIVNGTKLGCDIRYHGLELYISTNYVQFVTSEYHSGPINDEIINIKLPSSSQQYSEIGRKTSGTASYEHTPGGKLGSDKVGASGSAEAASKKSHSLHSGAEYAYSRPKYKLILQNDSGSNPCWRVDAGMSSIKNRPELAFSFNVKNLTIAKKSKVLVRDQETVIKLRIPIPKEDIEITIYDENFSEKLRSAWKKKNILWAISRSAIEKVIRTEVISQIDSTEARISF